MVKKHTILKIVAALLIGLVWFGMTLFGWIVTHAQVGSCTGAELQVPGSYCGPKLSFWVPTVVIYSLVLLVIYCEK